MTQQISIKASIPELIDNKNKALQAIQEGMELIRKGFAYSDNACVGNGSASYELKTIIEKTVKYKETNEAEKLRIALDRAMWRSFVVNTPLWGLMDTQARKEFDKSMEGVPPEATIENLAATMEKHFSDADIIFRRSLINTFATLDSSYKTNDAFKIGGRITLTYIQDKFGHFNHYAEDRIRDLDRVFWILDGKDYPSDYNAGLCGRLRCEIRDAPGGGLCAKAGSFETDYFKIKFFKNGSVHIWMLREDLVLKANRLIAEHYGVVLPDENKEVKPSPSEGVSPSAKTDFFRTPDDVSEMMVDFANITPESDVLEPSAGDGSIVEAIAKKNPSTLYCVEINPERSGKVRDVLRSHGRKVVGEAAWGTENSWASTSNFLHESEQDMGLFDAVIMNPPFNSYQWVRHVLHAWQFVEKGGRLVALVPTDASAGKFTAQWDELKRSSLVDMHDLPHGTFKSEGTMVCTTICVFEK